MFRQGISDDGDAFMVQGDTKLVEGMYKMNLKVGHKQYMQDGLSTMKDGKSSGGQER